MAPDPAMQIDLFDGKPSATLVDGNLELWRLKDGRFLLHVMINNKGPWIELSTEQAAWLAAELVK